MPRIRGQITGSGFIVRSPRILLNDLDDHAGSYSTVQRTGDTSRPGTLATNFDDKSTIIFSQTGNPVFPSMLPQGSTFNLQAFDMLSEKSDISITAPIRSAQHPTYLHYSPEEQMGPFDENRAMPATDFFLSGTDPDIMSGFTSPIRSKVAIEIDITPQTETLLTRNVRSRAMAENGTRAQGAITIGFGIPGAVNISIISSDGHSVTYRFMAGVTGDIDTVSGFTIVSSDGLPTVLDVANRYRDAILHPNGHAGRINCISSFSAPNSIVTMTQAVGGTAGNTTVTELTPDANIAVTSFTGGLNNGASIGDQSGFMYYNFVRKEWEQIGLRDPRPTHPSLGFDYAFDSDNISGSFPAQFSISPSFPSETINDRLFAGYANVGSPTNIMEAPNATKYYASSSQRLRLSDYINSPILLEAVTVSFDEVLAQRVQGDNLCELLQDKRGASRDIDNYVFFAYRQDRSFKTGSFIDAVAEISGSTRSLIFSGSMSFWNSSSFFNDSTANAALLHSPAFDYNFGLPYNDSFMVGNFRGPIKMNVKPAVAGRQMTGLGRYFDASATSSTVLSRNFWPGGTSPRKSEKEWATQGSPTIIDAYGWSSNPDSAKFSQGNDSRAFRTHGGEGAPANLTGFQATSNVEQSSISPYLLLPTDEIVFGLDAGISQVNSALTFSSITGSNIRITPKKCTVTFYGSLIQNNEEHAASLNQNLSSNSVHEIIGAEPLLDQFQIEQVSSYYGTYLDNIVTGSMAIPSADTTFFTITDQDNSRRIISRVSTGQAGTTGSLQRFVKMPDFSERTYDSCLPNIETMITGVTPTTSSYSYIGDNTPQYDFSSIESFHEKSIQEGLFQQFPFASNPTRNKSINFGIAALEAPLFTAGTSSLIASFPANLTGQNLDNLNILYKTRYEYFSYVQYPDVYNPFSQAAPSLITGIFYLLNSERQISVLDGFVSYYREIVPEFVGGLNDLTLLGSGSLDGTPTDDNAVTHTRPTWSLGSPVFPGPTDSALTRGAKSYFPLPVTSSDVRYFEAAADYDEHKMVDNITTPTADVPFSITCAFKWSGTGNPATGDPQYLIERAGENIFEYSVFVNGAGFLIFRKFRGATTNQYCQVRANVTGFVKDTWYHITVTYDGNDNSNTAAVIQSHMKIYINGILESRIGSVDSVPSSPDRMYVSDASSKLRIGTSMVLGPYIPEHLTALGDAYIHSIGIWKNRALTAQDASDLYNAELIGTSIGPVRHKVGQTNLVMNKAPANRYGISNVDPEFSSARWNATSFGQPRDMLEQRLGVTTSDGAPPIKIRFISGSAIVVNPNNTHAQNLSTFATSSIPWIDDGLFYNREDNPDETLLIV